MGFVKHELGFNSSLLDGPLENWPKHIVAEEVIKAVEEWDIKAIVSFDEFGITGHRNHIDTAEGCMEVKRKLKDKIKLY